MSVTATQTATASHPNPSPEDPNPGCWAGCCELLNNIWQRRSAAVAPAIAELALEGGDTAIILTAAEPAPPPPSIRGFLEPTATPPLADTAELHLPSSNPELTAADTQTVAVAANQVTDKVTIDDDDDDDDLDVFLSHLRTTQTPPLPLPNGDSQATDAAVTTPTLTVDQKVLIVKLNALAMQYAINHGYKISLASLQQSQPIKPAKKYVASSIEQAFSYPALQEISEDQTSKICSQGGCQYIAYVEIEKPTFIHLENQTTNKTLTRDRGWKLHVSIDMSMDNENIERAWPIIRYILMQHKINKFKVVAPPFTQFFSYHPSQCAKAVTVYAFKNPRFAAELWRTIVIEITDALIQAGIRPGPTAPYTDWSVPGSPYCHFRTDKFDKRSRWELPPNPEYLLDDFDPCPFPYDPKNPIARSEQLTPPTSTKYQTPPSKLLADATIAAIEQKGTNWEEDLRRQETPAAKSSSSL